MKSKSLILISLKRWPMAALCALSVWQGTFFSNVSICLAQPSSVQVRVSADFTPKSALGIIISDGQFLHRAAEKIEVITQGTISVTFPIDKEDLAEDSFLTAMIVSEQGDIAFGEVLPLLTASSATALSSIPECEEEEIAIGPGISDYAVLDSLVEVRLARVKVNKSKVTRLLTPELLARLRKMEAGFGFNATPELSPDLHPLELISRLANILNAVKNANKHIAAQQEAKRRAAQAAERSDENGDEAESDADVAAEAEAEGADAP